MLTSPGGMASPAGATAFLAGANQALPGQSGYLVAGLISVSWTSQAMDTSKQTRLAAPGIEQLVNVLSLIGDYHKDIAQQMVFIRDQLREIDLTLQAIVAYND